MVVLSATKERVQKAFSNYILIDFNYIIQTYDMYGMVTKEIVMIKSEHHTVKFPT